MASSSTGPIASSSRLGQDIGTGPATSRSRSSSLSITSPRTARRRRQTRSSSISSDSVLGAGELVVDELDSDDDYGSVQYGMQPAKKKSRNAKKSGTGLGPEDESALFDPDNLNSALCQWGTCQREFFELEPFVEHIMQHAIPETAPIASNKKAPALTYICDWVGCPRRGKDQKSRFALVGHLRGHTGEKPFSCARPECDKSFTRTDALQKHMRNQHGEGKLPAAASATPATSKKSQSKRGARAGSFDSNAGELDDDFPAPDDEQDPDDLGAGADTWSDADMALFAQHPDMSREALAYIVAKAKWRYLLNEHEGLLHEAEALGSREKQLKEQCGELVDQILRKELGGGNDPEHSGERVADLDTFVSDYNHRPPQLPAGWTADK